MIFEAFLRWVETAGTQKRAEAATALGRAFCHAELDERQKHAARLAMTYLLEDPSPIVRMALAHSIAGEAGAPRSVVLALCDDQTDIAAAVVSRSPVLTDADLIDIAGRGNSELRAAIAIRDTVSPPLTAAIAEIGRGMEVLLLLRNENARFSPNVLLRLAGRLGADATVRELLLMRPDLPTAAHQILIEKVSDALGGFNLVRAAVPAAKLSKLRREACDTAVVKVIGNAAEDELPAVTEHLRKEGRLTTAFLVHALGAGRTLFFAEAISNLSGVARARARSILASGRPRAVRALVESAGIGREISPVFCHAVDIWRREGGDMPGDAGIFSRLAERCRADRHLAPSAAGLVDFVEKLAVTEMRQIAKSYADDLRQAA